MNLKVLKLKPWMKNRRGEPVIEIPPIYNRDGYYRYGTSVWFEYEGKAYILPVTHLEVFDYDLNLQNPLRDCEVEAIETLLKNRTRLGKTAQQSLNTRLLNSRKFRLDLLLRLEIYKMRKTYLFKRSKNNEHQ